LINPSPGCRFRPSTAKSVRCAKDVSHPRRRRATIEVRTRAREVGCPFPTLRIERQADKLAADRPNGDSAKAARKPVEIANLSRTPATTSPIFRKPSMPRRCGFLRCAMMRSSNDEAITTIVKNSRARGLKRPAGFPRFPCRGSRRCRTRPWRLRPAT
jgi:hypothetical protein